MAEPISADSPALRSLAKSARIKPATLARALNDPDHFLKYLTPPEIRRVIQAGELPRNRLAFITVWPRVLAAIDTRLAQRQQTKDEPKV